MTFIAVLSKNGSGAPSIVLRALESLGIEDSRFILASPSAFIEAEDAGSLHQKRVDSEVAVGAVFPKHATRNMPEIVQNSNAVCVFEGRLYPPSPLNPLSQAAFAQGSCEKALQKFLKEAEGDFSLVIVEPERILTLRDPVGVQPLYYGENGDFAALASNRTALWRLGLTETCSFPPGNVASVTREGFKFKPVRTLAFSKPRQTTLNEAARELQGLLEQSVRVRVHDVKEVAVAFSGGLDSSVVAFLAKKCEVQVHLVHVSLRGQPETEDAKKAAAELKLPLSVCLFEPEDVEKALSKVVALIEDADPVKAAVGVPFYWVAKKTVEFGLDVLLAGQGADELFGGYQRYVNEYLSRGEAEVREMMFSDVVRLPESNIERDEKICDFHGVELRLPFASFGIAEFALSLPVDLKIEKKADGLRKLVLRRLAHDIGLPEAVVKKPKKAVQYATGVNAVLGKLAKKQGLTVGAYVDRVFEIEKS